MDRMFTKISYLMALMSVVWAASARGQAPAPCEATGANPVAICFAEQPLTIVHCGLSIQAHFVVKRWHAAETRTVAYRFSYQLLVNNSPVGDVMTFREGAYPFTEDDPNLKNTPIPFEGNASYALRVTVSTEDGAPAVAAISAPITLEDKPIVRGLVIGISHYDNPSHASLNDLLHADADAKSFGTVLRRLVPGDADSYIDIRTSDDAAQSERLSKATILNDLDQEAEEHDLCGDDDWFIFYFSGHGVVGVNQQHSEASHFLSTKQFDPSRIGPTAISLIDLFAKFSKINATNELVILDSCFSGAFRGATDSQSGSGGGGRSVRPGVPVNRSSKVLYDVNGELVAPIIIGSPDASKQDGDVLIFQQTATRREPLKRALYLSAAGSDHEAEEGFVSYGPTGLDFKSSDQETENQKPYGHGLYTFAFLANLLAQLPRGTDISNMLQGAMAPGASPGDCLLDFEAANLLASADIKKLGLKLRNSKDIQTPNIAGRTSQGLRLVTCKVPVTTVPEASDVQVQ